MNEGDNERLLKCRMAVQFANTEREVVQWIDKDNRLVFVKLIKNNQLLFVDRRVYLGYKNLSQQIIPCPFCLTEDDQYHNEEQHLNSYKRVKSLNRQADLE
jgi:hypothetical protein